MKNEERIINHSGLLVAHLAYEKARGDTTETIINFGHHLCSCGHLHPWVVGECGYGFDCERSYCKTCNTYRPLVVQNERLVMDCSSCEACRLLACIH